MMADRASRLAITDRFLVGGVCRMTSDARCLIGAGIQAQDVWRNIECTERCREGGPAAHAKIACFSF